MTVLLFDHDKTVAEWVGSKIGKPFSDPYTAIGTLGKDGNLTGGAVFTNFTGTAIEISIAGRGVVCRSFWTAAAHYVFEQLKCTRLSIHTSRRNRRIKKMAHKFGFVFEGVSRGLFGKTDGLCYSIIKDDLPALKARRRI